MTIKWTTGRVIMMLTVVPGPVVAQLPPAWTQVAIAGPAGRVGHSLAFDSQRGKAVTFGGFVPGTGALGDTFEWDGSVWTQVSSTGPTPRLLYAMSYDSQRGVTMIFGGASGLTYFGETWEWDGAGWTMVHSLSAIRRANPAMVYDSQRGRTVMFGGQNPTGYLPETREWNGSAWLTVSPAGPPVRSQHAMAYDSQRGRTVLFGGRNNNLFHTGTWEWDGSTWAQVASTGPAGRRLPELAYDSQHGKTMLFGGDDTGTNYFGDTWEWDGSAWTQLTVPGPAPRRFHAMAYDSHRGRAVLFGGEGPNGLLTDTWEWNSGYLSTAVAYGAGCGSPSLDLAPVAAARPTIGTTAQASLTNIPSVVGFVALGWSNTVYGGVPLPLSLAQYGMPGCELLQSYEAAALPTTPSGAGAAVYSLPIPNWGGLIGLQVYLQGWAPAPGANVAGVIVSNGLEWGIGNS